VLDQVQSTKLRVQRVLGRAASFILGSTSSSVAPVAPAAAPGRVSNPEADVALIRNEPPGAFLWLDRTTYESELAARRKSGRITAEEAELLRTWAENGYVVIKGCIDDAQIDAALADVERMWNERWHVSIDVLTTGERTHVDQCDPAVRYGPHKLNDLYLHSKAVRNVFLHERIVGFAEAVFEQNVVGINSLTFAYGSQQPAHVDHVYMTPSPPRRLIASWIALEDVQPDSGPLELWTGSHVLPPFDFGGDNRYHYTIDQQDRNTAYLASQKPGFSHERFMARRGDVLLWHAMLMHGGSHIETPTQTRKSMACHYYSRECFESTIGLKQHGRAWFMQKGIEDPD
jgi:phytanoyl-CoA hydroxylase